MPTLADFLDIEIPREQTREIDGISLIGPVSIINPKAQMEGKKIAVSWKALQQEGEVKIQLSTTNHFHNSGSADEYVLAGKVDIQREHFEFEPDESSSLYKIVIEGPHNSINQWITADSSNQS